MLRLPFLSLLILGLALGACRRRPKATEPAAPVSATEQSVAAATPAPSSGDPAVAQTPAAKAAYATQADIDAYNRALAAYCYRVSDIPTDLNDLKNRRGLPPLPVPPPGRQLTYKPDLKLMEMRTAFIRME